jgi:hypothetical protein
MSDQYDQLAYKLRKALSAWFVSNAIAPPAIRCRVSNNSNISIATAAGTALTFDTERYDATGMHSTATNTGRITALIAGQYAFWAHVRFASNATGFREVAIRLNGTLVIAIQDTNAINGVPTIMSCAGEFELGVGDYAEVIVYQNSGGNLNVEAVGAYSPEFSAARLL